MVVDPAPLDQTDPGQDDLVEDSLVEEPVVEAETAPEIVTYQLTRATSIRGADKVYDSRGYTVTSTRGRMLVSAFKQHAKFLARI